MHQFALNSRSEPVFNAERGSLTFKTIDARGNIAEVQLVFVTNESRERFVQAAKEMEGKNPIF